MNNNCIYYAVFRLLLKYYSFVIAYYIFEYECCVYVRVCVYVFTCDCLCMCNESHMLYYIKIVCYCVFLRVILISVRGK